METKKNYWLLLVSVGFLAFLAVFEVGVSPRWPNFFGVKATSPRTSSPEARVLPPEGIVIPARWGDLGVKMVSVGVIDKKKFESMYETNPALREEAEKFLGEITNDNVRITPENSGLILNLLWALGLGNKNDILERGPMMTYSVAGSPAEALAKAGNFASTGGWTLARGNAMEHYSRHPLIVLAPEEQKLVEEVSKNIYRPCCDNPTSFPDCNHGMAMLGLLELMASQGIGEEEMYRLALQVNAYWFPDTYLTIAEYLKLRGLDWENAGPKEILGKNYSSSSGYQKILSQVTPPAQRSGGSCGI